jgi:hypothetical protein
VCPGRARSRFASRDQPPVLGAFDPARLRQSHGASSRASRFSPAPCKPLISIKKCCEAYRFNRARAIVPGHTVADLCDKIACDARAGCHSSAIDCPSSSRGLAQPPNARSGGPTRRGSAHLFLYYDVAPKPRRLPRGASRELERRGNTTRIALFVT